VDIGNRSGSLVVEEHIAALSIISGVSSFCIVFMGGIALA
jgi:hypothetical protein